MSAGENEPKADEQPAATGSPAWRVANRLLPYAAVGLAALGIGAGATWLALRTGAGGPVAATHGEDGGMPGAPVAAKPNPSPRVRISPEKQQLIGVRTAAVERRELALSIRTVGVFAYDETRLAEIHTKVAGWVERVYVNFEGKAVRRGDPLFTIYSPDLVSTQSEYLLARRQQQAQPGFSLAEATRRRLKLWDISDAQIAELERTQEPSRTLTLHSPFDGVVVERSTFLGQYITPETSTMKVADLSKIWVIAELFENEAGAISLGQPAEVRFPYGGPAAPLEGKVAFISPGVDARTRRVKVRIEFKNPGTLFKPQAYVTVVIRSSLGQGLAVPKEAVIDTGARQYALLALAGGYFEPRDVRVGAPADEYYPVTSGLKEGDRVVTSAQFLVDSETNLEAAMKSMSMSMPGMDMGETGETGDKGDMADMPGMDNGAQGQKPSADAGSHDAPMPPGEHEHRR